jgi:hypothetical protein
MYAAVERSLSAFSDGALRSWEVEGAERKCSESSASATRTESRIKMLVVISIVGCKRRVAELVSNRAPM